MIYGIKKKGYVAAILLILIFANPFYGLRANNISVSASAIKYNGMHDLNKSGTGNASFFINPGNTGLYYIPINISNRQNKATGVYQQNITINSTSYASYINGNWTNVFFQYGNGTRIDAWIESGANNDTNDTLVWVKLYSIPASSSITIYMVTGPKSDNYLSWNGYIGEAPEISLNKYNVYGKYDNGARVFNMYQNFTDLNGSSAWTNSSWAVNEYKTTASIFIDNGTSQYVGTANAGAYTYIDYNKPVNTASVVESYASMSFNTEYFSIVPIGLTEHIGAWNTSSTSSGANESGAGWIGDADPSATANSNIYALTTTTNSLNYFNKPTIAADSNYHVFSIFYPDNGSVSAGYNYTIIGSTDTAIPPLPLYLTTSYYLSKTPVPGSDYNHNLNIYWIRIRTYPPNGVMPSVSTGKVYTIPVAGITLNHNVIDLGQNTSVTMNITNGSKPYEWTLQKNETSSNLSYNISTKNSSFTYIFIPAASGNFTLYFNVTDNNGFMAMAVTHLQVNPRLNVSISLSSSNIYRRQTVYVTNTTSGGKKPYSYQYYVTPYTNLTINGNSITFNDTGRYKVTLNVTDSLGENATATRIVNVSRFLYNVTFREQGLKAGITWNVTFGGSSKSSNTSTITFYTPNGTYNITIKNVKGYNTSLSIKSITVDGSSSLINVSFSLINYTVTFTESGLTSNRVWTVTLNGTTKSSNTTNISFIENNGVYNYTVGNISNYIAVPYRGNVTVNGSNITVHIAYKLVMVINYYDVSFKEIGLPSSTSWTVTLNGTTKSGSGNEINFTEANGRSYTYGIMPVPGYRTTNYKGTVPVAGSNVTVTIKWNRMTYNITFVERGLSAGTNWSVTLNNNTLYSTVNSIVFAEPNGTYSYIINNISGYSSNGSGRVTVNGTSVNLTVSFESVPGNTSSSTGFSSSDINIILIVTVIIIVTVVLLYLIMRKKGIINKNNKIKSNKNVKSQPKNDKMMRGDTNNISQKNGIKIVNDNIAAPTDNTMNMSIKSTVTESMAHATHKHAMPKIIGTVKDESAGIPVAVSSAIPVDTDTGDAILKPEVKVSDANKISEKSDSGKTRDDNTSTSQVIQNVNINKETDEMDSSKNMNDDLITETARNDAEKSKEPPVTENAEISADKVEANPPVGGMDIIESDIPPDIKNAPEVTDNGSAVENAGSENIESAITDYNKNEVKKERRKGKHKGKNKNR